MPSHTFSVPAGFEAMTKLDQVVHRLQDFCAVAQKLGYEDIFKELVDPWIDGKAFDNPAACTPKASKTSSTVAPPSEAKSSELSTTLDKMNSTLENIAACIAGNSIPTCTSQFPEEIPAKPQRTPPNQLSQCGPIYPPDLATNSPEFTSDIPPPRVWASGDGF